MTDETEQHLLLLIEHRDGKPQQEPVHVRLLPDGSYRLLYSPGLVEGIAAGDEFQLLDDGAFKITRRGGNVAVQVYSRQSVAPLKDELERRVASIGGVLDGSIERGMVFTIPLSSGWNVIEKTFDDFVAEHTGLEWQCVPG